MEANSTAQRARRQSPITSLRQGWELVKYLSTPWRDRLLPRFPRVKADRVLGIACTGHGASLAYVDTSGVVRSSQLERWTGVKHMMMFSADEDESIRNPQNEIDRGINYIFSHGYGRMPDSCIFEETILPWFNWLVRDTAVGPEDIELLVTSNGHFATGWSRLGPELRRWFPNARIVRNIEHHEIHQRQAFWASGFDEAAVLTLDTCGEELPRLKGRQLSGTIAVMDQSGRNQVVREFCFPEMSSGTLYDAVTMHIGFHQGEAGKTMGLAAFGEPTFFEEVRPHLHLQADGGFRFLDRDAFKEAMNGYTPGRYPKDEMKPRHRDIAYAGQAILEAIVINAWRAALEATGQRNLVYAGGVALNSVANELAFQATRPKRFYVPPNPGDPGHALGCALFGAYELAGWAPPGGELPEYLGPSYEVEELERVVSGNAHPVTRPDALEATIARCIANGHIIARFDGAAEFGPRALGNRSIMCDPRRPGMKDYLNLRVKHREPFRPFAPSVLVERAGDWFDLEGDSPYMLRVVAIRPEKVAAIPAIAHVDDTARVQTVSRAQNPGYYRQIEAFYEETGVPLILNTSFNLAGKPIVETPQDAVDCFESTEIDILVLGPFVLSKRPLDHFLTETSGV